MSESCNHVDRPLKLWFKERPNGYVGRQIRYTKAFSPNDVRKSDIGGEHALRPYITGEWHITTKQVPNALAICGTGVNLAIKNADSLLGMGFSFVAHYKDENNAVRDIVSIGQEDTFMVGPKGDELPRYPPTERATEILRGMSRKAAITLKYADPFKILQGRTLAGILKVKDKEFPQTLVWQGDQYLLSGKIPARFLGEEYTGNRGKTIDFVNLSSLSLKKELLYRRTFWGRKLNDIIHPNQTGKLSKEQRSLCSWGKNLKRKIDSFFEGEPHPEWSPLEAAEIYADSPKKRERRARSLRFLQVLTTINGMFAQRFIAFPEEVWTWNKFDFFVLKNIDILLDDEFFDGELTPACVNYTSRYSELKKLRKTFKMYASRKQLDYFLTEDAVKNTPPWLRHMIPLYIKVGEITNDALRIATISTLSQTRGCGTPPPIVLHQSKIKFLKTVSAEPIPLDNKDLLFIRSAVREAIKSVPDHVFSGLATKARISITTTACLERIRAEGGTLQAIADLVTDAECGVEAVIIDLHTGERVTSRKLEELDSIGEYIFWRCLEHVLKSEPDEMRKAFITVVKEPGKGRTVTKGSAYLKIVLDVINKICSWPLTKIETSKSGMSMDAHGWNFFLNMFDVKNEELVFDILSSVKEKVGNEEQVTNRYRPVHVECTDYNCATDMLQHQVAWTLAKEWLEACGIPHVLKQIVYHSCFQERRVYFSGGGIFSPYGEREDYESNTRYVSLKTGVLMGDPLTKVILHLINITVRVISERIVDGSYQTKLAPLDTSGNPMRPTEIRDPKTVLSTLRSSGDFFTSRMLESLCSVNPQSYTEHGVGMWKLVLHPYTHRFFVNEHGALDVEEIPQHLRNPALKNKRMVFFRENGSWLPGHHLVT